MMGEVVSKTLHMWVCMCVGVSVIVMATVLCMYFVCHLGH